MLNSVINNTEGALPYIVYCLYARRILNEPWALAAMARGRNLIHPGEYEAILSILDVDIRRMSLQEALTHPQTIDLRHNEQQKQTSLRINIRLYGHLDYFPDDPNGNFPTVDDMGEILSAFCIIIYQSRAQTHRDYRCDSRSTHISRSIRQCSQCSPTGQKKKSHHQILGIQALGFIGKPHLSGTAADHVSDS